MILQHILQSAEESTDLQHLPQTAQNAMICLQHFLQDWRVLQGLQHLLTTVAGCVAKAQHVVPSAADVVNQRLRPRIAENVAEVNAP